ncbi:uncharacterized protein LOC141663896 isoform X2 [Apium graveolens]|uniref:uncharacterized protein LOC141663896 isoform X2 n=1 Tax=Apium graveolens TaxID=4045 RepID=UPI003D7A55FE
MAHQNLLRDLLREDQEPFQVDNYIAQEHCSKLCKPLFYQTSSLNLTLCTKSCFKPSLFHSPRKTPFRSAALFQNIPSKTAAVLLEAATKIQKHSSIPKTPVVNIGFCSFVKRLRDKNISRKCSHKLEVNSEDARLSSAGWSESNEGKSLDLESSSTTSTYDYTRGADIHSREPECSSSQPFCFSLQRCSHADHTPEFLSPVASPISHHKQKIQVEKEEEEEKDQCSPVSVLAPPFQDDHEQHRGDSEYKENNDFDVECSYANVQRARLELLNKLRRFGRPGELDPVELEKRMLEDHEDEEEKVIVKDEDCNYVNYPEPLYKEENLDKVVREVLSRSNEYDQNKISLDVRRLLLELIAEERKSGPDCSSEVIVSRVCKRLNAWKEVQSNTIDMMVELDFREDADDWTLYKEEVKDKAGELELAIFGLLLEELVLQ